MASQLQTLKDLTSRMEKEKSEQSAKLDRLEKELLAKGSEKQKAITQSISRAIVDFKNSGKFKEEMFKAVVDFQQSEDF